MTRMSFIVDDLNQNADNQLKDLLESEDETVLDVASFEQEHLNIMNQMILEKSEDLMKSVFGRWHEMGLGQKKRLERMNEVSEHLKCVWEEVNEMDRQSYEKMIKLKNFRFQQINEMLAALHEPSFTAPTNMSLIALSQALKEKFEELKFKKDERMNQLISLKGKRDDFCSRMGEEPLPLELMTSIPSEAEISNLQAYVSTLKIELNHRKSRFLTTKEAIVEIVKEMEYEAKTEFEKSVLVHPEDKFILSQSNLEKLIKFHKKLTKENEDNKEKKLQMFKRLDYLWDRLDVPDDVRQVIKEQYKSNSIKTLEALKVDELDKYEQIRQEKMAEFIENLKPVVMQWWDKCYVSEMDKNTFLVRVATLEDDSEELLNAWEEELEQWKNYFAERGHVFERIETWAKEWIEFVEIENAEKDPDRYKSRRIPSTQIMKEQQKKKKLMSSLKKIENELSALSDKFAAEGNPMMFHGLTLKQFILSRRDEYEASKENEKEAKKVQKRNQLAADCLNIKSGPMKGGVCVPRKTPTKRTGQTSVQASPASANKLRRLNGIANVPPPSRVTPMAARKLNLDNTGSVKSKLPTPAGMYRAPSTLSINEDDFQSGLKNITKRKGEVNSTFIRQ